MVTEGWGVYSRMGGEVSTLSPEVLTAVWGLWGIQRGSAQKCGPALGLASWRSGDEGTGTRGHGEHALLLRKGLACRHGPPSRSVRWGVGSAKGTAKGTTKGTAGGFARPGLGLRFRELRPLTRGQEAAAEPEGVRAASEPDGRRQPRRLPERRPGQGRRDGETS